MKKLLCLLLIFVTTSVYSNDYEALPPKEREILNMDLSKEQAKYGLILSSVLTATSATLSVVKTYELLESLPKDNIEISNDTALILCTIIITAIGSWLIKYFILLE